MSNEINTTKFYKFLAGFESKGGWENVADSENGNGDGTVIKSEFRNFLNANWNGEENGELTNDLVNSFWKKLDTNTSANKISGTKLKNLNALDKKEVENLDKKLEIYVQFDEFVKNNVKVPSSLSSYGSQWKADVTADLDAILTQFLSGTIQGDLNSLLAEALPDIENKNTALYCAVEYQDTLKNGILADYPEYKVADDKTLESLINAYVATLDGEIDAESIKEEIRSIVDAYLATAELGEDSGYDLESLGFKSENLNDIQKAVITAQIKTDLKEEAENYEDYEKDFNLAVEQFIEAKIKEGGDFDSLKNSASEFLDSKYKTQLDNTVTLNRTYKNIEEGSDFYNVLVEEFGESLAKSIAKNDRYIDAYKEIINDVATKVNSGEMTMDEVEAYILKQISANLEKFISGGLDKMRIEDLNSTYNKLAASAEAETDDKVAEQKHREAAIKYCDALVKKGGQLKEAVTEAFGTSNYKGAINEMHPGDIQEIITALKEKALEIGDVLTFKVASWNNLPNEVNINLNNSKPFKLNATITDGSTPINNNIHKITYEVASGNAKIEDDTLTITASSTRGDSAVKVNVLVDGVKVGTQTITVRSIASAFDWGKMDNTRYNGYINMDGSANTPNTAKTLGELYSGNGVINLLNCEGLRGDGNWHDNVALAKSSISNFVDFLTSACKNTGNYEESALTEAANKVKALYQEALTHSLSNWAGKKSDRNNQYNYDGESYNYTVRKWYSDSTANNTGIAQSKSANNNDLGLVINEAYDHDNFQIVVNTKCVMDLFNRFYELALTA